MAEPTIDEQILKELKRIRIILECRTDEEGAILTYEEAVDLEPVKKPAKVESE